MLNSIENKKILIVIGGGIAAYKVLDVIRELRKNNCEVKTILTNSGKEFVTPLSISALSKNKVFENLFDPNNEGEMDHIALSRWCDLILVAPTTANLMANFAHGEAKDFATTVIMASNKPIFLAPAMNVEMWNNQATQENFQKLIQFKYKFIGPIVGEMACGEVGVGKMSSPEEIILTNSGKEFVTPLSISALSKNKVFENLFDPNNEGEMDHIALSRWCDLILVAPTTANLMANFAHGEAKDFATTVIMASNKPIFLAPAMNVEMWNNQATQENFQKLIQFKYKFIGPVVGEMACGEVGVGKMSSPEEIILTIKNYFLSKNLFNNKNLKALVTAGSTREYIDPVRFLSNESSGKQGFEIAKSLNDIGFKTKLVIGPNSLNIKNEDNLEVINVTTAKQMFEACKDNLPVDVAVCTAAVSDFKVKNYSEEKIKKEGLEDFNLELEKNIDILSFIASQNINRPRLVVGFAAETKNIIENAQKKIQNKHCDWIVANNVADKSIGFNSDYNEVFLISKNKEVEKFNKTTKSEIAKKLSNKILHALIQ